MDIVLVILGAAAVASLLAAVYQYQLRRDAETEAFLWRYSDHCLRKCVSTDLKKIQEKLNEGDVAAANAILSGIVPFFTETSDAAA